MKTFTVLVVDREPRIVNFLRVKLRTAGYAVLTANGDAEGLEITRSKSPDVVVLGLVMPGIYGFRSLTEVRSVSSVPVIVMTTEGGSTPREEALRLGASDYLPEPFNPDELISRIEALRAHS